MRDQERPDLCRSRFLMQHQGEGVSRFVTTQSFTCVFATADLLQVGLETCGNGG